MRPNLRVLFYGVGMFLAFSAPAFAADGGSGGVHFSAAIGAAVAICGAGYGIGRIGQAALEGMARQPEVANKIQLSMIIAAAFIEGVTLFALVICFVNNGSYKPYVN